MASQSRLPGGKPYDWDVTAAAYRARVNGITKGPAQRAVDMAKEVKPIEANSRVIDVGAGGGVVTTYIAETTEAHVTATDKFQGMLDVIEVPADGKVEKVLVAGENLTDVFPANSFSHTFCTFVLHVVEDQTKVLQEINKITQPGGVVAIAMWGTVMDNNTSWEQAIRTIDPDYHLPERLNANKSFGTPEAMHQRLANAGFVDIKVTGEMKMSFGFESAEDWTKFFFEAGHPCEVIKLQTYTGDVGKAREAYFKTIKEDFDDARGLVASAVVGVARKPA